MSLAAEKEMEHLEDTWGCADHDLVHELSKRFDALWRYDQGIANVDDRAHILALASPTASAPAAASTAPSRCRRGPIR